MKKVNKLLLMAFLAFTALSGVRGESQKYMVFDLSGGASATNYPVTYLDDEPEGGWVGEYRVSKLALVKQENSASYIGLYKITKAIYFSAVGEWPGEAGDQGLIDATETNDSLFENFFTALAMKNDADFVIDSFRPSYTTPQFNLWSTTNSMLDRASFYLFLDRTGVGELTVENGTVNGLPSGTYVYAEGTTIAIEADTPPVHQVFDRWGREPAGIDLGDGFVETNANTSIAMPATNLTMTALFKNASYSVAIETFTTATTNSLQHGSELSIDAGEAPSGEMFKRWFVMPVSTDLGTGFHMFDAITTIVVPTNNVTITAQYETIPTYTLTVTSGMGSGAYLLGEKIPIQRIVLTEQTFLEWTVTPPDTDLGADFDKNSPVTTVTIPDRNVTVVANYVATTYALTVNQGSGSGNYVKGATVDITASVAPTSGHEFAYWTNVVGVTLADINAASTVATILGGGAATVEAVYRVKAANAKTYMIVDLVGEAEAEYLDAPPTDGWQDEHKTTKMVFRKVPQGSFMMGSPSGESGRGNSETLHQVTLTKDFYLGVFEVTQGQWQQVNGDNPSFNASGSGAELRPVEMVTYKMIRGNNDWPTDKSVAGGSFIAKLRTKNGAAKANLPTEAQWERASRNKDATLGLPYMVAWYNENSGGTSHAVGLKSPNDLGLYDMLGNVEEMCLDWWSDYLPDSAQEDPLGPIAPATANQTGPRVRRGGAFNSQINAIRPAYRTMSPTTNYWTGLGPQTNAFKSVGLRVALPQESRSFRLEVVNGAVNTGGVFSAGDKIGLEPMPHPDGRPFERWEVAPATAQLGTSFNATDALTLLTMPTNDVTVTARYVGIYRFVQNNPQGVEESERAVDAAEFTITAPTPAAGYKFSGWSKVPASADLGANFDAGSTTTTVKMPDYDVTVTPNYALDTPDLEGQNISAGTTYLLDASDGMVGTFSAKGLPYGLKLDKKSGLISGVPKKAGTYTVQMSVKLPNGTTLPYTVQVTVAPLPLKVQGTFTGYIVKPEGGANLVSGLVTIKTTARGSISAKIDTATAKLSFSAKAWDSADGNLYRATMVRRQGETLTLEIDATTGELTATSNITGGTLFDVAYEVYAVQNGFADRKDTLAQAELAKYLGYYTVALPIETIETDPQMNNIQSGNGYLSITVQARGSVKLAGKLPDGTKVSGSTTLLSDGSGGYVPQFVKLYSKRGWYAGLLKIDGGNPTLRAVSRESNTTLEWLYPGKSRALTGDGFVAELGAGGALYDKAANLQTEYAGALFNILAIDNVTPWWSLALLPGSGGSLAVTKDALLNPDKVTFKANKRTGVFSGKFKAIDDVTGRAVTYKHDGALLRNATGEYVGYGSYIISRKSGGYTLKESHPVEVVVP